MAENPPEAAPLTDEQVPGRAEARSAIEDKLSNLGAAEVAEFFINAVDIAVCKVVEVQNPKAVAHWKLSTAEKAQLIGPATKVAELYMPNIRLHPVTALALTGATVYGAKYVTLPSDLKAAAGNQPATAHGGSKGQPEGSSTNREAAP